MAANPTEFKALVHQRAQLANDIKEATDERKFLDHQITEYLEEIGQTKTVTDDGYSVTVSVRRGSTKLDPALLLAAGVTAAVIAKCTVTGSPSQSIRVTVPKESA